MWCTLCNTGFDWESGRLHNLNAFHNPHYTEYLQKRIQDRDGGIEPIVRQVNCDQRFGDLSMVRILDLLHDMNEADRIRVLQVIHQLKDIYLSVVPKIQPMFLTENLQDPHLTLRLAYMVNEISEERFAKVLYQREYAVIMSNEYRELLLTYMDITNDLLHRLLTAHELPLDSFAVEYTNLVHYTNQTIESLNTKFKKRLIKPLDNL